MRTICFVLAILVIAFAQVHAAAQPHAPISEQVVAAWQDADVWAGCSCMGISPMRCDYDSGTLKLFDDEATLKRFHRPGLLAQVWKGEK